MDNQFNLSDLDNKAFNTNFKDHSENENDDLSQRTFKCKYLGCDKTFRYRSEFVRHTITHNLQRPYVCPYKECQKAFKRSDALATHLRIHTGDKPYNCPVGSCQLSFSTKAGLRYHVLKHKNDKVFRCDFGGCDQSFLTLSQLKQHQRGAKVHDNLIDAKSAMSDENRRHTDLPIRYREIGTFEPMIVKHQHVENQPVSTKLPEDSANNMKSEKHQDYNQNGAFSLDFLTHNINTPGMTNVAPTAFSQNPTNTSEPILNKPNVGAEDQASLLKKINKILDENTVLKKHLEICQKIIGIFQSNMSLNNASHNNAINANLSSILHENNYKF